jgi:putative transposase
LIRFKVLSELNMPRRPRTYLPGIPSHVVQRGNNREPCFFADSDYQFYLECLKDALERYRVALHAYVLMTNHVHLLMTPTSPPGISRVMQSVGRRYVQYVNLTYRRSGTLWEGRHKASLVQADTYLLKCYRYIELNPVAADMVHHPADYRWSSYRAHAHGEANALIRDHELYESLGTFSAERQHAYRELFRYSLDTRDIHAIRSGIRFGTPLGNERFKAQIEVALGRKLTQPTRGRPRKAAIRSVQEMEA